jgi:hypothetical protein
MAGLAFQTHGASMPVFMTVDTPGTESKVGGATRSRDDVHDLRIPDVLPGVTILAPNGCMFAGSLKSSQRMIKCDLVKTHGLRIPSEMIFVARDTLL